MKKILERYLIFLGFRDPRNQYLRPLVRYFYTPAILVFLFIPSIFSAVDFIKELDKIQLSYTFFSLIVPVQYLLGIRYYRQNHLHSTIYDCEKARLRCFPSQIGIILISIFLATCLFTIDLCLLTYVERPKHFLLVASHTNLDSYLVLYWIYG